MNKSFRKILVICLAWMLLYNSSQASFAKLLVLENSTSFHLSLKKVKPSFAFDFLQNTLAEEFEEEKSNDNNSEPTAKVNHSQLGSHPSLFQIIFSHLYVDFLKIKSHLFRYLFLLFHCLKIPCI